MRLFVGDDWAEDHHDIELMDQAGRVLARRRLPEGVAGMAQLHDLIGRHLPADALDAEVAIGIETDRGPWVMALIAAGYTVYPVNPLPASRYREQHGVSGAKSDDGDRHMLADMVRTDSRQLRPAAGDSPQAEAIKVLARTHKTLIWERTRAVQRLRHQLREYFPAALEAFEDLDAPDALELLAKAPDPDRARRLTRAQIAAALKRARRRGIAGKTDAVLAALRSGQLGQPAALTGAYAATARSLIAVITTLNEQVKTLQGQVEAHFGQHPDAEIYLSQPGLGAILGARVLAESGDDSRRYADGTARRNYAATSPITRASGKKKIVAARYIHNDRLIDALTAQAFASLNASPGARARFVQAVPVRAVQLPVVASRRFAGPPGAGGGGPGGVSLDQQGAWGVSRRRDLVLGEAAETGQQAAFWARARWKRDSGVMLMPCARPDSANAASSVPAASGRNSCMPARLRGSGAREA
jgi:transposase